MSNFSRRQFATGLAFGTAILAAPSLAFGARPRVVVVGGGAGGATAARYIAKDSKGAVDVTLVEASKTLLHLLLFKSLSWWVQKLRFNRP